ncbi:NAD(P)/FAD-dependent oxidoreductase [Flavobacteriaceae bacterium LMO-SS05]
MKQVDYIIVGCGLAGIAFCEQLRIHNKSFLVFDDASQQSSMVAVGMYNPVVLKRFTEAWKAKELLSLAIPKYKDLEQLLQVVLDYKLPVYRKFASIEEQNQWFSAADKPSLEHYLSIKIKKNSNPKITAPYGFGEVFQTGRIDTAKLVKHYKNYLKDRDMLALESFNYKALEILQDHVEYEDVIAKQVVFAEGFGVVNNPYFKNLPLQVAKGEMIIIKAPDLKIDFILKSSVFIVPLGNDLYSVGATYNWHDITSAATESGREELENKLKTVISCDYKIVDQVAGVRPTVKDRRPLVGKHSEHKNLFVLNGLGTRGVMIAPFVAEQLYNCIENKLPLEKEIDITRFTL